MGGLLATEILFKHPTLFNTYIIVSPSLWWDDGSLLQLQPAISQSNYNQTTNIYIGVGKEGVITGPHPHVQEVDANLLADKIQQTNRPTIKVYFDYLPGENHATIMHQSLLNALRLLNTKSNR